MEYILIFLLGSLLGSFCNVVGYRVPKKLSITFERSKCVHCEKTLGAFELIPVFSYVFLLGKCHKCKKPIPWLYPLNEFFTATLFVFLYIVFKEDLIQLLFGFMLVLLLNILVISDYNYKIIPNKVLKFFFIIMVPYSIIFELLPLKTMFFGLLTAFLIMLLMLLVTKGRGYGGGDVKLFLLLGLLFSPSHFLLAFFVSNLIGFVFAMIYRIKYKTNEIPFGPSIMLAFIIVFLYGEKIISWYMNML